MKKNIFYFLGLIFAVGCTMDEHSLPLNNSKIDGTTRVEEAFPSQFGDVVKATLINGETIEYQNINGVNVFQGDIILPEFIFNEEDLSNGKVQGTGRRNLTSRWPNNTVPFLIDPALPNQARVISAIQHWESRTPIRFVDRTNQSNYITFRPSTGCSSNVGMIGGQQFINLADACSLGNTIHEIGHAIGLWHEQSRLDRNNSIVINWNNIQTNAVSNFRTYSELNQDGFDFTTGYDGRGLDFGSIMLYGSFAFSANNQPTITRLDGSTFNGQRNGLSIDDIACATAMYSELYIMQNNQLHAMDITNGNSTGIGGGWIGTNALTGLNGRLYAVQGGVLWSTDPINGAPVQLGNSDWSGTEAMTGLNGYLYAIQGNRLWRANPSDGSWIQLGNGDWAGTQAMTDAGGFLFIVHGDELWRVDPSNGSWVSLGNGWAGTEAMTSLNGNIYTVQGGTLWRTQTNGSTISLGGSWSGTTSMAAVEGNIFIQRASSIFRVDPNNGNAVTVGPAQWNGTLCISSRD